MRPGSLMKLGAALGLFSVILAIVSPSVIQPIFVFASGAVFGKGYGIWEERNFTR